MSVSPGNQCYVSGCPATDVRRCYFCPNVCCAEHGTISANGTVCAACSEREAAKRNEATNSPQAVAKASVRLVAALAFCCIVACLVMRVLRLSR